MDTILDYIWPIIAGLAVLAIAGIYTRFFPRKKPKPNSQKINQFGLWNNATNNITDKDAKED